ncbi:MAG: glycosyltransferase family 4 protein, partial [Bacteroidota bacterium]
RKSQNTYYDGSTQGFQNLVPGISTPVQVIPYGFKAGKWRIGTKKPRSFLTVALLPNMMRYVLKGADQIVEIAARFPDCTFTIVGFNFDLQAEIPPNVKLISAVPFDELVDIFATHTYYFQLSISEGHPNALCEAMMSGCVPIVSDVTSMPDIVADTGFIVKKRNLDVLQASMEQALQADTKALGEAARARVSSLFPFDARRASLKQICHDLLAGNPIQLNP